MICMIGDCYDYMGILNVCILGVINNFIYILWNYIRNCNMKNGRGILFCCYEVVLKMFFCLFIFIFYKLELELMCLKILYGFLLSL